MPEGFRLASAYVDVTAHDNTDVGTRKIQQKISRIRGTLQLDADDRALTTKVAAVEARLARLRAKPHTVEIDAQIAKAEADLVRLNTRLQALRDKRITINVDMDIDQVVSRTARVNQGLSALGRLDPFAHLNRRALMHVSILGLVATAAGAAGAAIAAVPALGASLGGGIGVLVGAFSGVGDALKGLTADQEAAKTAGNQAASAAAGNARQIRDAQAAIADARRNQARAAEDATERVADAERDQQRVARDSAEAIASARERERQVTEDTAEAIADARSDQARVMERGAEQMEDASRRVADALNGERDAEQDLIDVRADVIRQMDDLREKVSDYALDQEGAEIQVIKAQNRLQAILADSTTTALDHREARHELNEALERQSDLTREQAEDTKALTDAERVGVNGSKQVIDAQGRLSDAHRTVIDAQEAQAGTARDVARANADAAERVADAVSDGARQQREAMADTARAVRDGAEAQADAARAVSDAVEDGAEAQEDAARAVAAALLGLNDVHAQHAEAALASAAATSKFAEAMADLTPEGRAFVEQLIRMKPLMREMRDTSQRSFLPGLTDMLRDSEGLFPIFHGHLERTGLIMGDTARKAGAMFKSDEFKTNLDALFRSSDPITRAIGDGLVTLSGRLVKFGADMAPAADGFAGFIDKTVLGMQGFFDKLTPHSEAFRRIWESLGRIMGVFLPVLADVIGQLAEHLAPALESVAGWMERNKEKVDDLIFVLGGLFLLFRGIGIVTGVAKWVTGVIGMFDTIGVAADKNKKKVGLLKVALAGGGILAGSAAIGAIAPGGVDDESRNPFDNTANNLGGAAGQVASGDFKSIFDDIGEEIKQLSRTWTAGEAPVQKHWQTYHTFIGVLPEAVRGWFGDMRDQAVGKSAEMRGGVRDNIFGTWQNVSDTISPIPGAIDGWFRSTRDNAVGRLVELRDSALQRVLETWVGFSGWWSRLGGDVNGWFTNARDRVGDRLRELKDGALQRASDTWYGLSGWWSRLGGDTNNWFAGVRDSGLQRLLEFMIGAHQRGSDIWGGFTGWMTRTRDDVAGRMYELRDRVRGALDGLVDGFWRTVDTIGRKWAELRELVAAPVRFVVNEVWNRVNDLWGGDDIRGFAFGGRVPGRGSSDTVPAMLTPGEFVVRKAIAEPSRGFLAALNDGQPQARAAVDAVQYFDAGGTVYQGLFNAVKQAFPAASLNSAFRPGDPGYHGRGQAVDLGQAGRSGGAGHPYLAAMNRWIHDKHGRGSAELIYDGIGDDRPDLKNGRPLTYNAATQSQHRDHVHWAMESLKSLGGGGIGGFIGGLFGGLAESAVRAALSPLSALVSGMPTAPPLLKGAPRDILGKVRDNLVDKALSFVGFGGAEGGGGDGLERWRGVVDQALRIMGLPSSLAGITLRRMDQESGGNQNAINRSDINWLHGTPSVGLMQVISGTYRAHRHPVFDTGPYQYGVSTNPLANVLASMRYSVDRYGSLPSAYNRPGGYDNGGMLPPGLSLAYNGTGRPEPVLTSRQLAEMTRRGPQQVTVNVIQKSGSPAETGRFVALALRGTG